MNSRLLKVNVYGVACLIGPVGENHLSLISIALHVIVDLVNLWLIDGVARLNENV